MPNRSVLEFDLDLIPPETELLEWAKKMRRYFAAGKPTILPTGVTPVLAVNLRKDEATPKK